MSDGDLRELVDGVPVPVFDTTAFTIARPLAEATVAIVTTAALRTPTEPGWGFSDQSYRILDAAERNLVLGHLSQDFDRSGFAADLNVVYPVDRLEELARDGAIGRVAPRHLSFMGAQDETMTTIRLDTGPAAAKLLLDDGVDVVLLTPV